VWTRRFTGINANLMSIASGGGLISAVGGGLALTSPDGAAWTSRAFSVPQGNGLARNLFTVVFGTAGFVAAGGQGSLYASSDGMATWTIRTLTTSRNLRSVAVGPAGYCAVGNNGTVVSSPDGQTWTNQVGIAAASNNNWASVTFANGLFVAVGNLSEVMSSPDCVTWTERNAGRLAQTPSSTSFLADVTFGNGTFVAVGNASSSGLVSALVLTSTDGLTWSSTPSGLSSTANHSLETVAYGAGRFVAMGRRADNETDLITSTDGLAWAPVASSLFSREAVLDILFANGIFMAAGTRIWTSADGLIWTKAADVRPVNALAFGNDLFVAAGGNGAIYSSFDGSSWIQDPAETAHTLNSVTYSASLGRFVAVGDSTIQFSGGVGAPEISIDDVSMQEGDSGRQDLVFTVSLSRPSSQTVTVNYATADGTALAGSDYVAASGLLSIPPTTTSATITIRVDGDTDVSPDEMFFVNLTVPGNATITDAQAVGTIVNNDGPPAVTVTRPDTGLTWTIAETQTLRFTHNLEAGQPVDLAISRDAGATWSPIVTVPGPVGATTYDWLVTGPPTTQGRVRATYVANPAATDISDVNFTILPRLRVTVPNGPVSPVWAAGSTRQITWVTGGLPPTDAVNIDFSGDNGGTWVAVASGVSNTGSFIGRLPAIVTTQGRIRVSRVADPTENDASDAAFTLAAPFVTVTAPNTGVTWTIGQNQGISWSHNVGNVGGAERVNIEISRDSGATWTAVASTVANSGSTTGTFNWIVTSPSTAAATARIRVTWEANPVASDTNNADFTIQSRVRVTSPNGGESCTAGTTRQVTWITGGLPPADNVRIDFSPDNGANWQPVAASVPNTGSFTGRLPATVTAQGRIRVSRVADPTESDASNAPFSLAPPFVTVTQPNTNVNWPIGANRTIQWQHNLGNVGNVERVTIEVSRNGGGTWTVIATNVPNNTNTAGNFSWTVTGPATLTARIRVTWMANPAVQDLSNVNFRIQ